MSTASFIWNEILRVVKVVNIMCMCGTWYGSRGVVSLSTWPVEPDRGVVSNRRPSSFYVTDQSEMGSVLSRASCSTPVAPLPPLTACELSCKTILKLEFCVSL